jgi:hypothetical protein
VKPSLRAAKKKFEQNHIHLSECVTLVGAAVKLVLLLGPGAVAGVLVED